MNIRIIVRDNIHIIGQRNRDEDLYRLDGYYISPIFSVEDNLCEPQIIELLWPYIEHEVEHMYCDQIDIAKI